MNQETLSPAVAQRAAREPDHLHFDRHAGVWRSHAELATPQAAPSGPGAVAVLTRPEDDGGCE
ncbi:MAG TPA: hypothetical protein VFC09_01405 [Candidatus Dormibacteraeota bacterium]|nr:hypothetical protein [Candidatus Dormibacteraeota bacterium]